MAKMRKLLESYIFNNYYLTSFLFPFFIIGLNLFGYPFNIPFIAFIFLSVSIILGGTVNSKLLYISLLFIVWSLLTAVFSNSVFDHLPSLISFVIVILPLTAKKEIKKLDTNRISKLLLISYYIVITYWVFQYLAFYLDFPSLNEVFPLSPQIKYFWNSSIKIPRFSAFFKEPAHLIVYLITIYVLVDKNLISFSIANRLFIKFSVIFIIIITLSLKGIGILLIYYLISFSKEIRYIINTGKPKKAFINTIIVFFSTLLILLVLYFFHINNGFNKFADALVLRVSKVEDVIKGNRNTGSEAVRINVVKIGVEYIQKEGMLKSLYGEGFAKHDLWIKDNVGNKFRNGKIQNVFIIVFISTGFIGIILFLSLLLAIFLSYNLNFNLIIISLLFFFFSGYLILYLNWIPILLFSIYSVKK